MSKKLFFILITAMMLFTGCFGKPAVSNENEVVSEKAGKVIETMLTCPNLSLYNSDMITPIGLGVELSDEKKEKIKAAGEEANRNWENAIGEYFGYGFLKAFLTHGSSCKYLIEADMSGKTITVDTMTLKERTEISETVQVTLLVNGEKQQAMVTFKYDADGLIKEVAASDIGLLENVSTD